MSLIANVPGTTSTEVPLGYPAELERDVVLADGRLVHVRPILPADAAALREAIEHADAATLRQRFVGRTPELSDAFLRRLTQLDYRTRLAVVAFGPDREGVGIARYETSAASDTADVAVAVDPGWRRVGLATTLLGLLVDAAVAAGIRMFHGHLLTDNRAAEALVRACGLPYGMVGSEGVAEVEIELPIRLS